MPCGFLDQLFAVRPRIMGSIVALLQNGLPDAGWTSLGRFIAPHEGRAAFGSKSGAASGRSWQLHHRELPHAHHQSAGQHHAPARDESPTGSSLLLPQGYRALLRRLRTLGFACTACIHPVQVPVFNEEYGPSVAEIDHTQRLIATFEAALASGHGAVAFEGAMIDLPIVERARRLLRAR